MEWLHPVTVVLFCVLALAGAACNYKKKDGLYEHTMCKYIGRGDSCSNYVPTSVSSSDRQTILDAHNEIRNRIASGLERGYMGAKDMYELEWDEELAAIAQRWTEQCTMAHDENRDIEYRHQPISVGQNLGQHNVNPNGMDYTFGVKRWFAREVIWAKTKKVGCGISQYSDSLGKVYLFACNYAPSGNYEDEPVYVTANSDSEIGKMCPKRSNVYKGLCAPSDDLEAKPAESLSTKDNSKDYKNPNSGPTDPKDDPADPTGTPTDPKDYPVDLTDNNIDPKGYPIDPSGYPTDPKDCSIAPEGYPTDPKDYSTDPKDYYTDPKDYSTDPNDYSTDPKDYSTDPKDYSTDPKDYSTDSKDYFTDSEDYSTGPKDYSTDPKDYPTDPKVYSTDPKDYSSDPKGNPTYEIGYPTDTKGYSTDLKHYPTDSKNKNMYQAEYDDFSSIETPMYQSENEYD